MLNSLQMLVEKCKTENIPIYKAVISFEEQSESEIRLKMGENLKIMKNGIEEGLKLNRLRSGMAGTDAKKLQDNLENLALGGATNKAMVYALAISEYNASMGKIVAAPTAGSCGILPAVVMAVAEEKGLDDENIINGLLTAAAIGMVIGARATLSGAKGGCQAECGSAGAMAAAAMVEMLGGNVDMAVNAVALNLKSIMGLVCDPVAGLVEVPCIKRNATGVSIAISCANMALSGIKSVIPADEVIDAMKSVGELMSPVLRETSLGGLATTPTGKKIAEQLTK